MDSSRRVVESYWRSRMIDAATSDEDKVAPVYKLEEICELLRSSHAGIVKEVSEFVLKRLEHKSPVVKQKALRLIKYAVGKSGAEFRREMQRQSVAVRQLSHYSGQPDPLKGEALNRAVRDTANEAIAAIFSQEESKPSPAEDLNKRIQGFGNTNFEPPSEEKKSFFSEVVGIGSASIKQGLSSFTQSHSLKKNDSGTYRGPKTPNLHRSLTEESGYSDKYEPVVLQNHAQGSYGISENVSTGPWGKDSKVANTETINGDSSHSHSESKTREERLLETIVTPGGVRLQPTRDALQIFLAEAVKLDELALCRALELKLQSPTWQVRMKAVCVLEALLRKKDDEHFVIIASYFEENRDAVLKCSESPQSSLQEKANKVLSLLGETEAGRGPTNSGKSVKAETIPVQMPDLIDAGDSDDFYVGDDSTKMPTDQNAANLTAHATPLIDDLFGDTMGTTEEKNDDDPFADVSFHTGGGKLPVDDLFSGMTIDDNVGTSQLTANKSGHEMFDIFGSHSEPLQENHKIEVDDFMAGLSANENGKQNGTSTRPLSESIFSDSNPHTSHEASNDSLSGILGSQTAGMNTNQMFPLVGMPYSLPPGLMLNPAFASQPMNYNAMGSLLAQQQLLATMANFQHLGQLNAQGASGQVSANNGGYSPALPDVFQLNFPTQTPTSTMNGSKKEETKAFDFISDHLAAARDPKKVL